MVKLKSEGEYPISFLKLLKNVILDSNKHFFANESMVCNFKYPSSINCIEYLIFKMLRYEIRI